MQEQEPGNKDIRFTGLLKRNSVQRLGDVGLRTCRIIKRVAEYIIYLDPNDPDRGKYVDDNRTRPTPGRWGNG